MTETSKKLKRLMKERGVTCYAIAKSINASETAVHAWVDGDYEPKLYYLKKLAEYFGVPLAHFIE